jgi:SAM-dependent methyltransferase
MTTTVDKAGKNYWNENWTDLPAPELIDPGDARLRNEVNLRLHRFFSSLFDPRRDAGKRLLEAGCARSVWLPYFAQQFGIRVAGIDYSDNGCHQEMAVLRMAGIEAPVFCADFFDPPAELKASFDYVVSFGVVEHFTDAACCISALANFLRPGGKLITLVPNMHGAVGMLQRFFDREIYATHVAHTPATLETAHSTAGLTIDSSNYFLATNFYVVNPGRQASGLKLFAYRVLGRGSMVAWQIDRWFGELPGTRSFSPYIVCTATKPA